MKQLALSFFLLLALAQFAFATECPTDCTCISTGFTVTYCVDPAKNSSNKDVLYHFHGAGNSATDWRDPYFYTQQVRQYWQENGYDRPTVVAISFDFSPLIPDEIRKLKIKNNWLLTEKDPQNPFSGLLPYLTNVLIPKIESELPFQVKNRKVVGESMGGFNSLQAALKTNAFTKAAVICAPLADSFTPFSTWSEIEPYAKTTLAWNYFSYTSEGPRVIQESVVGMQSLAKVFIKDLNAWAHTDPFQLLQNADVQKLPQLYITSGAYDPYLSYEGSLQFSNMLKAKGARVEWRPQWGGHCAIDIPSLAEFLIH